MYCAHRPNVRSEVSHSNSSCPELTSYGLPQGVHMGPEDTCHRQVRPNTGILTLLVGVTLALKPTGKLCYDIRDTNQISNSSWCPCLDGWHSRYKSNCALCHQNVLRFFLPQICLIYTTEAYFISVAGRWLVIIYGSFLRGDWFFYNRPMENENNFGEAWITSCIIYPA